MRCVAGAEFLLFSIELNTSQAHPQKPNKIWGFKGFKQSTLQYIECHACNMV